MSLEKIGTIKQLLSQQRVQMIEKSTGVHYFPDAPAVVYNPQLKNKTKRLDLLLLIYLETDKTFTLHIRI